MYVISLSLEGREKNGNPPSHGGRELEAGGKKRP